MGLDRSEGSHIQTFLLADKSIRGVILDGTLLVQEMQNRHELGALETLILGQAMLVTALMASLLKGQDGIGLRIDCTGPVKGLVTEATAKGEVRGYLKQVPIPLLRPLDSFESIHNLNPYWQDGLLTISHYLEGSRQPFNGNIALQSGNIASEVTHYYQISEQLPTAMNVTVFLDIEGKVAGAGGLLLQSMPGTSDKLFTTLEQKTKNLPSLGKALARGQKISPWLHKQFAPFHLDILGEHPVHFYCRCDALRIRRLLLHLPLADLEEMRDNGPFPVQVSCHFCNKEYHFDQQTLTELCQEKRTCT
ncbi:MAG: Hsp33 family molecular chaperone HslO [Desulfocapsaceae bacterium]|nr:Hsp33 family molecular chaperone HslO [Desulfocapsaceae bacterium]